MTKILRACSVVWLDTETDFYAYLLEMKKKVFKYHLKQENGFLWV